MKIKYLLPVSVLIILLLGSCKQSTDTAHTKSNQTKELTQKPIQISSSDKESSCVYLTEDENQIPILSWVEVDTTGEKAFYFAKMDIDKGKFSESTQIPIPQNTSVHEEGMPKIAVKSDGTLLALYEVSESMENSKWGLGDVRYIESFDNGKNWSEPKSVAPKDYQHKLSSSFSGMARLDNGEIGIAWLGTNKDEAKKGRPVKFAQTVGKDSLSEPILIDEEACECCRIALNTNRNGELMLAYRDLLPGNIRDISAVTSHDNGKTFKTPVSFSGDHWEINGCPHNGPSVVGSNGHFFVTWFTGKEGKSGVNYAVLDSLGRMKSRTRIDAQGQFIQVGLLANTNPILVYNEDYQSQDGNALSKILIERTEAGKRFRKEITLPNAHANYPVVKPIDEHNLVVAWVGDNNIYYRPISVKSIDEPVEQEIDLLSKN